MHCDKCGNEVVLVTKNVRVIAKLADSLCIALKSKTLGDLNKDDVLWEKASQIRNAMPQELRYSGDGLYSYVRGTVPEE